MKEEYLWNKTGEDAEIERLENALSVFRYQETEPPALPAKIIPFEKKTHRGFFHPAFGFAAFAAILVVCLGAWFQFSNGKTELAQNPAETIAPPTVEKNRNEIPVQNPEVSVINKVETPSRNVEPKVVKITKIIRTNARPNDLIARKTESKKPSVKLTAEEKYAYNQLMLALSITSSKLKLVEDKIYGTEKPETTVENGR